MMPSRTDLFLIAYGPCGLLGPRICYFFHGLLISTYGNMLIILPISFAYRNYILNHTPPEVRTMVAVVIIGYIPGIALSVQFIY